MQRSGEVVTAPQALVPSLCAQNVRMVRRLVPRLPALPVCLAFVVQLLSPCSAEFAVVGPPEPILAVVGEEAELCCHLSPKMSAETMEVLWWQPSLRQVVHTYAHGQENTLAEGFRGRTSILREDITVGKVALQIRDVRASDNGTYLCYFRDGDFYAKAKVELQVAALGSDPHTEMKSYEAGGVRLECMSAGWYPPPQIEWRDAGGQSLPTEAVDEAADPRGLYAVSASVILEGVPVEASCVIRNPLLGQEKSARLSIPGSFFRVSLPRMAVVALPLLHPLFLLCLLWRWRKRIRALSQDEEEKQELRMQQPGQSCSGSKVPQSQGGTQDSVILPPRDTEGGLPAAVVDSTPLLEQQGAAVVRSEDPQGAVELQEVVPAGDGPALEQVFQTQVPPGTWTRPGQGSFCAGG